MTELMPHFDDEWDGYYPMYSYVAPLVRPSLSAYVTPPQVKSADIQLEMPCPQCGQPAVWKGKFVLEGGTEYVIECEGECDATINDSQDPPLY